jgi:hypothetical protein
MEYTMNDLQFVVLVQDFDDHFSMSMIYDEHVLMSMIFIEHD